MQEETTKKSRFEISREVQEEFVNGIAQTMIDLADQGQKWIKPWTSDQPMRFPFNPSTGHEYSGANMVRLMLTGMAKGYKDDRWVTFKQLKEYQEKHPDEKIHVRSKEKGTRILRPEEVHFIIDKETGKWAFPSKKELEQIAEDKAAGKEVPDVQSSILFYSHTVFNGDQIEGMPQKEKVQANMTEIQRNEFLEKFIASSGVSVEHHAQDRAYYSPENDSIKLPLKEKFHSTEAYYATKMHEFYHATGHKNRENRLESTDMKTKEYAFEEMRAEMFSMLSGAHLGLPVNMTNSAAYIESWNKTFSGGEARVVFKAASEAGKMLTVLQDFEYGEQPRVKWFPDKKDWPQLQEAQTARDKVTEKVVSTDKEESPKFQAIPCLDDPKAALQAAIAENISPIDQFRHLMRNPSLLQQALETNPKATAVIADLNKNVREIWTAQHPTPSMRM